MIVLACLGLHYKSMAESATTMLLVSGTFVGYTVILVGVFAGLSIQNYTKLIKII